MNYFLFLLSLNAYLIVFDHFNIINILSANSLEIKGNLEYSLSEKPSTRDLKEIFLKKAKFYYPKDNCSIIIYGIPEEINGETKLSTYVIDLIRNKLKLPTISPTAIESIRRIGGIRAWIRPVQVAFMTKDIKEMVLKNKHLIRSNHQMRVENFLSKREVLKTAILSKFARKLRKRGHHAAVKNQELVVDGKIVNGNKESLLKLFPDISAGDFDGL